MLNKQYRLKSRYTFRKTLDSSLKAVCPVAVIYGLTRKKITSENSSPLKGYTQSLNRPRFGFITSKKVHKSAVIRNQVKRRHREIIRYLFLKSTHPLSESLNAVVIIARKEAITTTYNDQLDQFDQAFNAIGKRVTLNNET